MQHTFKMGQRVKDVVTGFEGVITGMAQHMTGCDTVGVNPGVDDKGKLQDVQWFDWTRLQLLDDSTITLPGLTPQDVITPRSRFLGGPQDHPHTI